MTLELTNETVAKMAALAVRASVPMGLGRLHFKPSDDSISHIEFMKEAESGRIYIDYYNGRMTKFYASRNADGMWEFDNTTDPEYQSWCVSYADYAVLASVAKHEYVHKDEFKDYYVQVLDYLDYLNYYEIADNNFSPRELAPRIQLTIQLYHSLGTSHRKTSLFIFGLTYEAILRNKAKRQKKE